MNPRSTELLLDGLELLLSSSWLLSSESASFPRSSVPETELLSVPDSESDLSFFFFEVFDSSSVFNLLFLALPVLESLVFWLDFLLSFSTAGLLGDFLALLLLLDKATVDVAIVLVMFVGVFSTSGLLALFISFFFPFVDDVLLLRRVRILCLEGVLSSSSGTGLNRYWSGLVLGGGESTPDSSPYFLYERRHFVHRTPPSLALCQSLEFVVKQRWHRLATSRLPSLSSDSSPADSLPVLTSLSGWLFLGLCLFSCLRCLLL